MAAMVAEEVGNAFSRRMSQRRGSVLPLSLDDLLESFEASPSAAVRRASVMLSESISSSMSTIPTTEVSPSLVSKIGQQRERPEGTATAASQGWADVLAHCTRSGTEPPASILNAGEASSSHAGSETTHYVW